jgi:hypothetical protein
MLHYENYIILDKIDSWPKPVINLLDSNFELLRAWHWFSLIESGKYY